MPRGLFTWLRGRQEADALPAPDRGDELFQLPEGLADDIATIEAAALDIYARHGLPVAAGGYVQRGPDAAWEKLPDTLSAPQKMALLDEAPENGQWRFVERSGIGRLSTITEVRRASALLAACEGLRARLTGRMPTTAQDVADALHLGSASAWLLGSGHALPEAGTEQPLAPLTFHSPDDSD